ncbi:hypothetical protein DRJ16_00535 [Candidatus Woesearchaeota archaeon]|nr:MAG: hypothetical protein DRJ16_00535 [Candidatus Woesearchaeota archaeon]
MDKTGLTWAEKGMVLLFLVGFVIAMVAKNAIISYIVIACFGFMTGRLLYWRRKRPPYFPWFLILSGFIFGYICGSLRFNVFIVALLYVAFAVLAFLLSLGGYLK